MSAVTWSRCSSISVSFGPLFCCRRHQSRNNPHPPGEVQDRRAGVELGRRLLQAGVIRHIINEHDFKDDSTKFYTFYMDDVQRLGHSSVDIRPMSPGEAMGAMSPSPDRRWSLANDMLKSPKPAIVRAGPHASIRNRLVEAPPLNLAGHGRESRSACNLRGLSLPGC